jgi:hypothetical protein
MSPYRFALQNDGKQIENLAAWQDDPNATPIASLTNIFSEPALLVCQYSYGWGAQGAGDGRGEHGHRADHGGQSTLALEKVERQPGLRPLHCDEPARL